MDAAEGGRDGHFTDEQHRPPLNGVLVAREDRERPLGQSHPLLLGEGRGQLAGHDHGRGQDCGVQGLVTGSKKNSCNWHRMIIYT